VTPGAEGYRTLGVAVLEVDEQAGYTIAAEHDMTLVGLAAFLDPPKEGHDAARAYQAEKGKTWFYRRHALL
jgi:magnesium-transporting ATPase (P-type)